MTRAAVRTAALGRFRAVHASASPSGGGGASLISTDVTSLEPNAADRRRRRRGRPYAVAVGLIALVLILTVGIRDRGLRKDETPVCLPDDSPRATDASRINFTFEDGEIFPPYGNVERQGNGEQSDIAVVPSPDDTGKAVRLVMPPSRGAESDIPSRTLVYPTPDLRWRSGDEVWYGISVYVDEDWDLSQIMENRGYFLAMLGMRWTDLSVTENGPGSGINMTLVGDDPVPHFVSRRETRGWEFSDGAGNDLIDLGRVVKGQWTDFVIHIKWSASPEGGLREYWRDGELMGRSTKQNMGTDAEIHHRMGIYQGTAIDHSRTIFWDNHRIGGSYAEVNPACS